MAFKAFSQIGGTRCSRDGGRETRNRAIDAGVALATDVEFSEYRGNNVKRAAAEARHFASSPSGDRAIRQRAPCSDHWEGWGAPMWWSHYGQDENLDMLREAGFEIGTAEVRTSTFAGGEERWLWVLGKRVA